MVESPSMALNSSDGSKTIKTDIKKMATSNMSIKDKTSITSSKKIPLAAQSNVNDDDEEEGKGIVTTIRERAQVFGSQVKDKFKKNINSDRRKIKSTEEKDISADSDPASIFEKLKSDPQLRQRALMVFVVFFAIYVFSTMDNSKKDIEEDNPPATQNKVAEETPATPTILPTKTLVAKAEYEQVLRERDAYKEEILALKDAITKSEEEKIENIKAIEEYKLKISELESGASKPDQPTNSEEIKKALEQERAALEEEKLRLQKLSDDLIQKQQNLSNQSVDRPVSIRQQKEILLGKQLPYVSPPNYEKLGRGLVYNCLGRHWACVDEASYRDCRGNMQWAIRNEKKIECYVSNVYANSGDCKIVQIHNINTQMPTAFCD